MNQKGQAQILAATVIGFFMLSGILASLELASRNSQNRHKINRRDQLRQSIDIAAKQVSHTFQTTAVCDPILLNQSLNDLSETVGTKTYPRTIKVSVSGTDYLVHFGKISKLAASPQNSTDLIDGLAVSQIADDQVGVSQDVVIEMWATFGNQRAAPPPANQASNLAKVKQYVALINTCSTPCISGKAEAGCNLQTNAPYSAYFQFNNANNLLPGAILPPVVVGKRRCSSDNGKIRGDLNSSSGNFIDLYDLMILRNYLRAGDTSESTPEIIIGTAADPAGNFSAACADLNGDNRINETDLNIMEKYLRGYLNWMPVHYRLAP